MNRYDFMEMNRAGNCFFIRYYHNDDAVYFDEETGVEKTFDDEWVIDICTDEECETIVDSYVIDIQPNEKWDEETQQAYIAQVVSDSVKSEIDYL